MASNLEELMKELLSAGNHLAKASEAFQSRYEALDYVLDPSTLSEEGRYQLHMMYMLHNHAESIANAVQRLQAPVRAEGVLQKQSNGRYAVDDDELTSGSYLEYWTEDSDGGHFMPASVEHNGEDYYIVGLGRSKQIEGLLVRTKRF